MNQNFLGYLQQEQERCLQNQKQLMADERKDEANFCKIEANIYEIFGVLYQTSWKQAVDKGADEAEAQRLFLEKAKTIPQNWQKNYEKAKEYHDTEKILIEEIKLQAVEKIMHTYHNMQEIR